jgi:hypothetical protein
MARSADGATWTATESKITGRVNGIAHGGNTFVAGGENGGMAYSTDGAAWTAAADSTFGAGSIYGIAYGANRFVAGGSNGKIAYSN